MANHQLSQLMIPSYIIKTLVIYHWFYYDQLMVYQLMDLLRQLCWCSKSPLFLPWTVMALIYLDDFVVYQCGSPIIG